MKVPVGARVDGQNPGAGDRQMDAALQEQSPEPGRLWGVEAAPPSHPCHAQTWLQRSLLPLPAAVSHLMMGTGAISSEDTSLLWDMVENLPPAAAPLSWAPPALRAREQGVGHAATLLPWDSSGGAAQGSFWGRKAAVELELAQAFSWQSPDLKAEPSSTALPFSLLSIAPSSPQNIKWDI